MKKALAALLSVALTMFAAGSTQASDRSIAANAAQRITAFLEKQPQKSACIFLLSPIVCTTFELKTADGKHVLRAVVPMEVTLYRDEYQLTGIFEDVGATGELTHVHTMQASWPPVIDPTFGKRAPALYFELIQTLAEAL